MAKRTAKKGSSRPVRLSADRLQKGWPGPAGTRVRLATAADTDVVDSLLDTAGARLIPALRSSIEQGTAGAALLNGPGRHHQHILQGLRAPDSRPLDG